MYFACFLFIIKGGDEGGYQAISYIIFTTDFSKQPLRTHFFIYLVSISHFVWYLQQ